MPFIKSKDGLARATSILTGLLNASGGPTRIAPPSPRFPEATWFTQATNFGAAAEADELTKNFWDKRSVRQDIVENDLSRLSTFGQKTIGFRDRGNPTMIIVVVLACVLLAILYVWQMFRHTKRGSCKRFDVERGLLGAGDRE